MTATINASDIRHIWATQDGQGKVLVYHDHVEIITNGFASLSREDLLSLAAALPGSVEQVAPYVICDYCGHKSWSRKNGEPCRLMTPSGAACAGTFESATIDHRPSKT